MGCLNLTGGYSDEINWSENFGHSETVDISAGGISVISLTKNGYVVFDYRFTIQWASDLAGTINTLTSSFPISFTNACYSIAGSPEVDIGGASINGIMAIYIDNKSQFSYRACGYNNGSTSGAKLKIIAVGY